MSCDKPEEHGYPFSHGLENAAAFAVKDKGMVPSILQRQVGHFLKSGRYSDRQSQRMG